MVLKFLKKIYRLIRRFLKPFKIFKYKIINFYIINFKAITNNRVSLVSKNPICYQKTFITGMGNVKIGRGCIFGYKLGGFYRNGSIEIQPRYANTNISIGNNVATNNNLLIIAANSIEIGNNTLIGQYVTIMDFEAHGIKPDKRNQLGDVGKVKIGENVWIGNNVMILKNTVIGNNSIVAAGAVVSGVFEDNIIIGGVPAKKIKDI